MAERIARTLKYQTFSGAERKEQGSVGSFGTWDRMHQWVPPEAAETMQSQGLLVQSWGAGHA